MWSRIYLIPMLQAEEDRDLVRRQFAQEKMEKELMGKNVPVYNNDKYGQSLYVQRRKMECANSAQVRAADVRRYSLECIEIDANKIPEFPFAHITEFGVSRLKGGILLTYDDAMDEPQY